MKYNQIHTTSSLRQERNIICEQSAVGYQPSGKEHYCNEMLHFLEKRNRKGFGSLSILFMECLSQRGIRSKMVLQWCTDLRTFLEYIEDTYCITTIADLNRSHIEAYTAMVNTIYEAGEKTFMNAGDANDLLSAVRMFCMYLYSAGMIPVDYGHSAPAIPYPPR